MIFRLSLALSLAFLLAWKLASVRDAGVRVAAWLESRSAPIVLGAIAGVMFAIAWGSLRQIPVVHDEGSYLFQAKLFATGHWTMPSPPAPEFFEQWHVFVVPHYASKYPPGHALLMVPGIWLGLPGLMPVLIGAATAMLVFVTARRLTNGVIAFWTWGWWATTPIVLWLLGSYFSQPTSAFCWMLGWYALLRWRDEPGTGGRWLMVVGGSVGWMGLTRPLTALAYALPIGVYVLWKVNERRQWKALGLAMAVGLALVLVIPLWSHETIDTVRTTPYALYSKMYFPWDAPGFGIQPTPPMRALPPDMALIANAGMGPQQYYLPSVLPQAFVERAYYAGKKMVGPPRIALALFAAIGLFAITAELAFALGSALVLLVAYLWFNHGSSWSVYYVEIQPALAAIVALGMWRLMHLRWRGVDRAGRTRVVPPFVAGVSMLMMLSLAEYAISIVGDAHATGAKLQHYQRNFLAALDTIPAEKRIVFVRYGSSHNPHLSLIFNDPDLAKAKTWLVYDRGPDNLRLMRMAPDRAPFLFDESRSEIRQYVPARDTIAPQ